MPALYLTERTAGNEEHEDLITTSPFAEGRSQWEWGWLTLCNHLS